MKTNCFLSVFCAFIALTAHAQSDKISLQAEARIDYQREYIDGNAIHDGSGFKGKYLNIKADAKLTNNLSVSYRQRLNKNHADQSFFDATDWLYINWRAADNVELSAGKQVVGIGGYEYDRAPIDLYVCSEYWNNIPCYQLGVSASYVMNSGKDRLTAQFCESPFSRTKSVAGFGIDNNTDMYAYNLMWNGSHGFLSTIWSVNLLEYQPGKMISYIALGNRFNLGKVAVELDLMNRAVKGHTVFLKDCSVMGEVSFRPNKKLNLFAKATYDVNNTDHFGDFCVLPGTEMTMVSGGVEYFPLKQSQNLRLHLVGSHSFGQNPFGTVPDKQTYIDAGMKFKFKVL